jgi:multidrug efflux pump subunit AcrA (membrane-fusion protein)
VSAIGTIGAFCTRIRVLGPAAMIGVALVSWGGAQLPRLSSRSRASQSPASHSPTSNVPVTRVRRGDVLVTVTARGELLGGNSEMLTAPMTGGNDMAITSLRSPGEQVKEGDVVVQFDPTEQSFLLKEAESDLAEAQQHVIQARAESEAKEEETSYQLAQAQADVRVAELEVRRNPLMAAIVARQNTLALEAARDHLRQLEQDLANRKATTEASVAIQEAARNKAKVKAAAAQKNIDSMTLRAKTTGYVNIQQNTNGNFMYWGMQLPVLQVGDTVRAGMAVAQIPDLKNWEVTARVGELDRGHLAAGQKVQVES